MTIFIQIASYRDPELGPTIEDCLANAARPNDLRFGICSQESSHSDYAVNFSDSRFRIKRFHWRESRGVCWARHVTQSLYEGEDFTLQIDSHHRFRKHWDQYLLDAIASCKSKRPILSAYPGAYDPQSGRKFHTAPMKIVARGFNSYGNLHTYPMGFEAPDGSKPVPARFIAAGFMFTLGRFCNDVPYDPSLYFAGEELSLALRAYTHGYDFYHPPEQVLWHEYKRADKHKHWDDHRDKSIKTSRLNQIDAKDHLNDAQRLRALIAGNDDGVLNEQKVRQGRFGLGSERSVRDYELFAGLDLHNKLIHQGALFGREPVTITAQQWSKANALARDLKERSKRWKVRVDPKLNLDAGVQQEFKLFVVSVFDHDDSLITRRSVTEANARGEEPCRFEFDSPNAPKRWVLSALGANDSWQNLLSGNIRDYRLMA
jgi:hypothetical protein